MKSLSRVRLFATPWTVAYQAPPSMGFSRQEYWSGLPFPSPGDLPDPGIEPGSLTLQADALTSEPPGKPDNSLWLANDQMQIKHYQVARQGAKIELICIVLVAQSCSTFCDIVDHSPPDSSVHGIF